MDKKDGELSSFPNEWSADDVTTHLRTGGLSEDALGTLAALGVNGELLLSLKIEANPESHFRDISYNSRTPTDASHNVYVCVNKRRKVDNSSRMQDLESDEFEFEGDDKVRLQKVLDVLQAAPTISEDIDTRTEAPDQTRRKVAVMGDGAVAMHHRIHQFETRHQFDFIPWKKGDDEALLQELYAEAEVVVGGQQPLNEHLPKFKQARLLQIHFTGYDWLDFSKVPEHMTVCNVFEHETCIAEYVMAGVLEFQVKLRAMD
eukprot:gene22858-27627_t